MTKEKKEFVRKKDLMETIINECGVKTKTEAETIVNTLFDTIATELKHGSTVEIFGFGKFLVTERKARQGINPATGEKIQIPATKVVTFKPAKSLKDEVK